VNYVAGRDESRPYVRSDYSAYAAVQRQQTFIRKATVNGTRRAWYLQLDIQNDFMSIDRDILFAQVAARCADTDALCDCTEDYVYKGPAGMHA
jgi:hypothetical protein